MIDWASFSTLFPEEAADLLAYRREHFDMPEPGFLRFTANAQGVLIAEAPPQDGRRWHHQHHAVHWVAGPSAP